MADTEATLLGLCCLDSTRPASPGRPCVHRLIRLQGLSSAHSISLPMAAAGGTHVGTRKGDQHPVGSAARALSSEDGPRSAMPTYTGSRHAAPGSHRRQPKCQCTRGTPFLHPLPWAPSHGEALCHCLAPANIFKATWRHSFPTGVTHSPLARAPLRPLSSALCPEPLALTADPAFAKHRALSSHRTHAGHAHGSFVQSKSGYTFAPVNNLFSTNHRVLMPQGEWREVEGPRMRGRAESWF